jgi:hypothetical protein
VHFTSDSLFADADREEAAIASSVIAVTLDVVAPGEVLDKPVTITFQLLDPDDSRPRICVYYDFDVRTWKSDGCVLNTEFSTSSIVVCECMHLTSFAVLLDSQGETDDLSDTDKLALGLITVIGLSISVILMGLLVLIYILVPVSVGCHPLSISFV